MKSSPSAISTGSCPMRDTAVVTIKVTIVGTRKGKDCFRHYMRASDMKNVNGSRLTQTQKRRNRRFNTRQSFHESRFHNQASLLLLLMRRGAAFHFLREADDVPIRESNQPMLTGAPMVVRTLVREVNTFLLRAIRYSDWTSSDPVEACRIRLRWAV